MQPLHTQENVHKKAYCMLQTGKALFVYFSEFCNGARHGVHASDYCSTTVLYL
jgi:hypothetical protein